MSSPATNPKDLPRPLVRGERLSPAEFDLRYEASPHVRRAELIRGVVHVASPQSIEHEDFATLIRTWLSIYAMRSSGLRASSSPTIHLPNGARAEPDAVLRRLSADALSKTVGEGMGARLHGAPELLAEVSFSTLTLDIDDVDGKRADYRESGVLEYLVVAPESHAVHWWHLDDGGYLPLPEVEGIIESSVFAGLRLNVAALLAMDGKALIDALG